LHAFAAGNAFDEEFEFVHSIGWNEHADVLPEDLLTAISIYPLRPGIPARDDSVEGLADDRILRCFDDRRKARSGVTWLSRDVDVECTNPTEGTERGTFCGFR
jgi:hypothetical protein